MSVKNNKILEPKVRDALNQFKIESAAEVGINLSKGYNGDITARQAGSIGGNMVKKMINSYERKSSALNKDFIDF